MCSSDLDQRVLRLGEDFLERVFVEILDDVVLAPAPTDPDHLAALMRTLVLDYVACPHEIHILNTQSHHLDQQAQASIARLQERLVGHARSAIAALLPDQSGGSKRDTALAMMLFGMVNWIPAWYKPQGGLTPDQLVDLMVRQFLGGLTQLGDDTPTSSV